MNKKDQTWSYGGKSGFSWNCKGVVAGSSAWGKGGMRWWLLLADYSAARIKICKLIRISKAILWKDQVGRLSLISRLVVELLKVVWSGHKDRQASGQNAESWSIAFLTMSSRNLNGEGKVFSTNGTGAYLMLHTNINLRWITHLNIDSETTQFVEQKRMSFWLWDWQRFLRGLQKHWT